MRLLNEALAKADPFAVARIESGLSLKKSIEHGTQLRKMGEEFGYEDTLKLITRLIENTAAFYNVNGNLTPSQLVQIAQMITEQYGGENIQDIVLAFKDARMGRFGKVYGRIDGEVIMGWIALYLDSKYEEMERQHHNRKHEAVNMAELHPKVLEKVKMAVERKLTHTDTTLEPENGSEISEKTDTGMHGLHTGTSGNDNDGVMRVDHDTWNKFWAEFRETFTANQLKTYRQQFENNSMFGYYTADIEWIDNRIEELKNQK